MKLLKFITATLIIASTFTMYKLLRLYLSTTQGTEIIVTYSTNKAKQQVIEADDVQKHTGYKKHGNCLNGILAGTPDRSIKNEAIPSHRGFVNDKAITDEFIKWLTAKYLPSVHRSLVSPECEPKFVVYLCSRHLPDCGGVGDRVRGMVAMFYLAVLSGRIFLTHVDRPYPLESIFQLNNEFYGVPTIPMPQSANSSKDCYEFNTHSWRSIRKLTKFMGDRKFSTKHRDQMHLVVANNIHYSALFEEGSLFSNPGFSDNFNSYIKAFPKYRNLTQNVLISAAVSIIHSKPKQKLLSAVEDFIKQNDAQINGLAGWSSAYRIGIQMRVELAKWGEHPNYRVRAKQASCFIQEAVRRAADYRSNKYMSVIVYVTSSDEATVLMVKQNLTSLGITVVAISSPPCHIDLKPKSTQDGEACTLRTYLDWYLLTQMHFVLASESGFSHSAALASTIPSIVFEHAKGEQCAFKDDFY